MLDALVELKKYRKINLVNNNISNEPGRTALGSIISKIGNDINRISKSQFRLEQQIEYSYEEIQNILSKELNIADTYKNETLGRDELINVLRSKAEEDERKLESLVAALISFSDAIHIIDVFIKSSGDIDWVLQMERVKNSLAIVIAKNDLHEIGDEKYFDDMLHEVVSAVEDQNKDFREIISVERKGYLYMGKIIRKARVVVNNFRKVEDLYE